MGCCKTVIHELVCISTPAGQVLGTFTHTSKEVFEGFETNTEIRDLEGNEVPDLISYAFGSCDAASDPGLEGAGIIQLPEDYVYLPTGEGPVWIEVTYDDFGNRVETFYYLDTNGETQVSNNSNDVGRNEAPAVSGVVLAQLLGEHKFEVFADGANEVVTAQDMVDRAVAAASNLRTHLSDGTLVESAALSSDLLVKIDVDLKYIEGGHGGIGEDGRSTTAEMIITNSGETQNVDGGGSRTFGDLRSDNWYLPNDFESIEVLDGSVVEVTIVLARGPADETSFVVVPAGVLTVFDVGFDDGTPGNFAQGFVAWNHEDSLAVPYDISTSGITYTVVQTDAAGVAIPGSTPIPIASPGSTTGPWSALPVDFTSWGLATGGGTTYYAIVVASNGDQSTAMSNFTA